MTTPRLDHSQREAWTAYRALRQRLDAQIARELEDASGLSLPDYEVLSAIAQMGEGCIRVNPLATSMLWSKSRLSRQLGRMERRGLIAREPCDLDGRGDDIVLTDDGRQALDKATPGYLASIHNYLIAPLSDTQLATLGDIARTVVDHIGRRI